jgi:iron-sulfur cluster assembly protein
MEGASSMSIKLTENAAKRVQHFLARDRSYALRVGVRKTGCSGWAYEVDLAEAVEPDDVVFEDRGVTIIVDSGSLPYVDGSEIDFVAEGLGSAFRFRNPNVTEECGCGESFTIDSPVP